MCEQIKSGEEIVFMSGVVNKIQWVLLVEDENDLRELLVERLTEEGYRVLSCGNVKEALKMCANQRFGCIILDYQLDKGGTGEQIVSTVRKNTTGFNIQTPLLMISAYLSGDVLKLLKNKINAALVKPFEPDVFVQKVKQLYPIEHYE